MPSRLPPVLASSVVRSTYQGESHGGLYLVDLEEQHARQVFSWDDPVISWEGRGGDRGLRGIGFYDGYVIVAASDEIILFDQAFKVVGRFSNPYLRHAHELTIIGDRLLVTSTGFDSVLEFNLEQAVFTAGWTFQEDHPPNVVQSLATRAGLFPLQSVRRFDPNGSNGPNAVDTYHINNVATLGVDNLTVSGTRLRGLFSFSNLECDVRQVARLPRGTHNARVDRGYLIYNHTSTDSVIVRRYPSGGIARRWRIARYAEDDLEYRELPDDHARQAFGRGLALQAPFVIGGSSPATVTIWRLDLSQPIASVNISMDVRNAIHGLAVWPYG